MRGIGVGSPEKLAAVHLNYDQTPDTLKMAGLGAIADDPPSGNPLRKIPEGSLPRSNHSLSPRGYKFFEPGLIFGTYPSPKQCWLAPSLMQAAARLTKREFGINVYNMEKGIRI